MALVPDNNIEIIDELYNDVVELPSKTWCINIEGNRIGSFIDDELAIRQMIKKAILTERNKYPIYSESYGNELMGLIGQTLTESFLKSETQRMIKECLIYDDRISDVQVTSKRTFSGVDIEVTVTTTNGFVVNEGVKI